MPLPNPTTLASHFYYVWMGGNCGKEKENLTKKKKKNKKNASIPYMVGVWRWQKGLVVALGNKNFDELKKKLYFLRCILKKKSVVFILLSFVVSC
jgi:hypothetical protein